MLVEFKITRKGIDCLKLDIYLLYISFAFLLVDCKDDSEDAKEWIIL